MSDQNERLWLSADKTEIVADGDPDAAFLLTVPGRPIPADYTDLPRRTTKAKPTEPAHTPKPTKKAAVKKTAAAKD